MQPPGRGQDLPRWRTWSGGRETQHADWATACAPSVGGSPWRLRSWRQAVHRRAMATSRYCFTFRQIRRMVPFMFSMMLVQAKDRCSSVSRRRRVACAARMASMTPTYLSASSACRAFAACHSSSSTMRSSGTSMVIHLSRGLRRETRLPVVGSLT